MPIIFTEAATVGRRSSACHFKEKANSLYIKIVVFLGIAVLLYACRYPPINNVQLPFIWTTIEASLMSLMFLSVERIVAFQYPFASKSIVTVKRTIIAIIFIWIFAITCGVFIYHYTIVTQLVMSVIFEVCVVIFLICQGYIILTMQKRKKAHLFCDRDVSIVTRKHIQRQRHSNNVTTVVLILIAVVVITLLPYMVAIQIYFLSELKLRPPLDKDTKKVVLDFIAYFYPIELLNFIVNPIIYAYRLKRYRKALLFAFSFLNCGPFVKERTRTFSDSKSADDFDKERRHSKRMTKLIAV